MGQSVYDEYRPLCDFFWNKMAGGPGRTETPTTKGHQMGQKPRQQYGVWWVEVCEDVIEVGVKKTMIMIYFMKR